MDQIIQQSNKTSGDRDVSRQTLVVLVVLAVVVSLLGTFTVLRETTGINKVVYVNEKESNSQSASGVVSLDIVDANEAPANSATGMVIFEVAPTINKGGEE